MRYTHGIALLAGLASLLTQPLAAQAAKQPPTSILIRGGTLVDGTGAPQRQADVRIVGDTITAVGKLKPKPDERVIDATGLVVAPGFIDTHSHADGGLLDTPDAETQIRQGITTSVVGQDGSSHLPLRDYFHQLETKHVALNIASFVGHGTVRSKAMGADYKRHSTAEEQKKMQDLVEQEMRSGALGLSSGLEYEPAFYADTEEVIACAKVAAAHGGIYISHVRNEDNQALESFEELIRIAREAHLPAQISHIKLGSAHVWGKSGDVLKMMADARKEGLDITADVYPYTYWQSTIRVLIPVRDSTDHAIWEKGLADIGGADHVLLSNYTPDPTWAGKTIAEIARTTGRDPVDVILEVIRKTHDPGATGSESVVVTAMQEADLTDFIADPHIMFCSDGGLHGTHPRGAGTFPRILGRYVREQHRLSLVSAIHKMTLLAATRMGFQKRGRIARGMMADIVLFDPDKVQDNATTAYPTAPPFGLPYVLVNGTVVLDNGNMTGARPGVPIRRTKRRLRFQPT